MPPARAATATTTQLVVSMVAEVEERDTAKAGQQYTPDKKISI